LNFPPPESWSRFNGLQQLTYFFTFFIAAPIQIAMGLLQGPAFSNRLGWLGRVFNRQGTLHTGKHVIGVLPEPSDEHKDAVNDDEEHEPAKA
jgi:thiosulfate reductase cytochrome b subunit